MPRLDTNRPPCRWDCGAGPGPSLNRRCPYSARNASAGFTRLLLIEGKGHGFDALVTRFNQERPHQALGMQSLGHVLGRLLVDAIHAADDDYPSMKVSIAMASFLAAFGMFSPSPFAGAQGCSSIEPCARLIDPKERPPISIARNTIESWIVSAQAAFHYLGHEVDRQTLASGLPGGGIKGAVDPKTLIEMLNRTYVDKSGKSFRSRTPSLRDSFSWFSEDRAFLKKIGAGGLSNRGFVQAFFAPQRPRAILVATRDHAALAVGVRFFWDVDDAVLLNVWILDPAPASTGDSLQPAGLRLLTAEAMREFFAIEIIAQ